MSARRVGFLAAAAALVAAGMGGEPVVAQQQSVSAPNQAQHPGSLQRGLSMGSLMQALASGGAPTGNWRPRYGGKGWSVAEGKRRARKSRNKLRAKGQHRRAVR